MASAVLNRLAATPASDLPRVAADGLRPLHTLYLGSLDAGLTQIAAKDDVERLYLLFDVAVSHGLGGIILDYVTEVCSDPFCTSRSGRTLVP